MKKFSTLCLAALVASTAFGQKPTAPRTFALSPAQIAKHATLAEKNQQLLNNLVQENMLKAYPINNGAPAFAPNGKVAAVNPIALGSASNVFSIVTTDQNQVWANNDLNMVSFIHRNDLNNFGGTSGQYRYDVSIDGGMTFGTDVGTVNPATTRPGRYPNMTAYVPAGTVNPLDVKFVYYGPTLDPQPDFDGHVAGVSSVSTTTASAPSSTTENYLHLGNGSYLAAGLQQGLPGEFWTVDRKYDGGNAFDPNAIFFINKGVWDSTTNDVLWARYDTVDLPNHNIIDGEATLTGATIAFSPDGMTGWISWLGDLVGGKDSLLSPVFMKSTDGGATWGAPVAYDLNTEPWVYDTLRTLFTDSATSLPASNGIASCAFDCDLTVDNQGNPHLAVVIGTAAEGTPYSFSSGLAKFLGDVSSTDGGLTWDLAYISPVLAFRGTFGTGDGVNMDNNVQVARNPLGNIIFYSWVDSDTAEFIGPMTGIGEGNSEQIAPNLRIAARMPFTNEQTYPKKITDADLNWEGKALFPTMAPVVLFDGTNWKLPIVMAEMLTNDPLAATRFWYFGNDATITREDFCYAPAMTITWPVILTNPTPPCAVSNEQVDGFNTVELGQSFPNPTANEAYIVFELPSVMHVNLSLTNMYGQSVGTIASGEMGAGSHKVTVDTRALAAGVYFYTLEANGASQTKKMIVSK